MTIEDRLIAIATMLGLEPPRDVTAHAVDRLIERWCPRASHEEARAALEARLPEARIARVAGKDKTTVWLIGDVPLVVSADGAVLTVLPFGERGRL